MCLDVCICRHRGKRDELVPYARAILPGHERNSHDGSHAVHDRTLTPRIDQGLVEIPCDLQHHRGVWQAGEQEAGNPRSAPHGRPGGQ